MFKFAHLFQVPTATRMALINNNMKKIFFGFAFFIALVVFALPVRADMMGESATVPVDDHTAREEAEGKEVWQKFQEKQVVCADLKDGDFGVLGEYFMGRWMGDSHAPMNAMMENMMGHEGEEQMHVVMGKRFSGCDESAVYTEGEGFLPMMNMMGGWSSPFGLNQENNSMMYGFGNSSMGLGFGFLGVVFMIFWWVLILAGIVALVKWLSNQFSAKGGSLSKSALDILNERYARGEIDTKEFEEKKKNLS